MSDPNTIRYSYQDCPTIKKFNDSKAFIRGLMGPIGSGKSTGCVIEMVDKTLSQKPGPDGKRRARWVVVRSTYRELLDTTIKTTFDWLPPHIFGTYKQSEQKYNIEAFEDTEFEILFRALDKPQDVSKLLSLDLTGFWLNEAKDIPWAVVDAVQGRVGRYPPQRLGGPSWYGGVMDTNPPDTESKWYEFFETKNLDPSFAQLFKQPSGLAPDAENLSNLPNGRKYYENLVHGKDPEWVKVFVHGQYGFMVDGRAVYPEYNDEVHCKECRPVKYSTMYRGWDFGLTPCCVFVQYSPTGQLLVLDELCSESMSIDVFADEVIAYTNEKFGGNDNYEWIDIGDPAGDHRSQTDAKTAFQILHGRGIFIEGGLQTPAIRQECVRRPLTKLISGKPQFVLNPRCKMLRKGFLGGYCYRRLQVSSERFTSIPDKNKFSHPHDALQYVCTRIFGGGLTAPYMEKDEPAARWSDGPTDSITGY